MHLAKQAEGGESQKCQKHPGMDILLYCKEEACQQNICTRCLTKDHQKHEVVGILEGQRNGLAIKAEMVMEHLIHVQSTAQSVQRNLAENFAESTRKLAEMKEEQKKLSDILTQVDEKVTTVKEIVKAGPSLAGDNWRQNRKS